MFLQGCLLASGDVRIDPDAEIVREALDATTWVDVASGWVTGADDLFGELVARLPWRQRRGIPMYDRVVDEPRLTSWWRADAGDPEPMPILAEIRSVLSTRYDVEFDSIGCNLYRDGTDSVAWHGDHHRHHVVDPIVAIVSVGAARPFKLRPRGGGPTRTWQLGRGDLLVMGGSCQHAWEHCVPKVRHAEPRMSITFRHDASMSSVPGTSRATVFGSDG